MKDNALEAALWSLAFLVMAGLTVMALVIWGVL